MYSCFLVTGSIGYDCIMPFKGSFTDFITPQSASSLSVSFNMDAYHRRMGGCGFNIAYNAAVAGLNANNNVLLGSVGVDGKLLTDFLENSGVSTKHILQSNTHLSSLGNVITDKHQNQIWGYATGAGIENTTLDFTPFAANNSLAIIPSNYHQAFVHIVKQCIDLGIDYMFDPGMEISDSTIEELQEGCMHCTFLIGNEWEMNYLQTQAGVDFKKLLDEGKTLITTRGAGGVCYQKGLETIEVPVFTVNTLADPTGAGDAWRGGFVAALIQGKSATEALCWANALASFAVEKMGTVEHKPTHEQIEERAKTLLASL